MTEMDVTEFLRLYEADGAFEVIDGERIPVKPLDETCAKVLRTLYEALNTFLTATPIGAVFLRTPYALRAYPTEMIDRVRVPDLMFYQEARLQSAREMKELNEAFPFIIPPDWTAILVSAQDSYSSVEAKIDLYFGDGVIRALWIIDFPRKVVTIMDRNVRKRFSLGSIVPGGIRGYTPGGAVIPGFQIPVQALFE